MTGKISRRELLVGTAGVAALAGCYQNLDQNKVGVPGVGSDGLLLIPSGEIVTIEGGQTELIRSIEWENGGALEIEEGARIEFESGEAAA